MVFTVTELLDMVLMTAIIGYLFQDAFRLPPRRGDILDAYRKPRGVWHRDWHGFWWACALIGPSIVIHELAHKFAALGFGLEATFHAACSTANIGGGFLNTFCLIQLAAVVLKTLGFGFLIFVPGFVSTTGSTAPAFHAIISVVGPLVHLVFWLGSAWLLRDAKRVRRWPERKRMFVFFFKQINMFLFILNMLPIPGFDGFGFFYNLYRAFAG